MYIYYVDITVKFTRSRYNFSENNEPQKLCQYVADISTPLPVLVLSNPASFVIIVRVMSSNITAIGEYSSGLLLRLHIHNFTGGGVDYGFAESAKQRVRFDPGVTHAPVNISINNDNILETNETFKLNIFDINVRRFVHFGTPGNDATVTIIDNDCKFHCQLYSSHALLLIL